MKAASPLKRWLLRYWFLYQNLWGLTLSYHFYPPWPCLPMSEITWLRVFFGTLCPQRSDKFSAAFSTPQKRRFPLTSFSKVWHCAKCQSGHPWSVPYSPQLNNMEVSVWAGQALSSSTNRWTREIVWKPLILVSSIEMFSWRAVGFPEKAMANRIALPMWKCQTNASLTRQHHFFSAV